LVPGKIGLDEENGKETEWRYPLFAHSTFCCCCKTIVNFETNNCDRDIKGLILGFSSSYIYICKYWNKGFFFPENYI
jgi:hypothetical protein